MRFVPHTNGPLAGAIDQDRHSLVNHLGPISGTLASPNFISSTFWQDLANIDQQSNPDPI